MQVRRRDLLRIGGERESALENVFEFAHVARERIRLERRDRFGVEPRDRPAREFLQYRVGDRRNVLAHFAETRHAEFDHVQPVEQILPEFTCVDQRRQAACASR